MVNIMVSSETSATESGSLNKMLFDTSPNQREGKITIKGSIHQPSMQQIAF